MNTIHIIGCGGVGSWLTPSMALLTEPSRLNLIDGDILETGNLNRQLFNEGDIGKCKAEALADRYNCRFIDGYYSLGLLEHDEGDWLMVCADNHRARLAALQECDRSGCKAILAANETNSSEAYYYQRTWRDSALDPRTYYPEIASDLSGDPMARAAGCTGVAQRQNPQLVSANMMAAALAQHLFVLWAMEAPKLDADTLERLPYLLRANVSRLETLTIRKATTGA